MFRTRETTSAEEIRTILLAKTGERHDSIFNENATAWVFHVGGDRCWVIQALLTSREVDVQPCRLSADRASIYRPEEYQTYEDVDEAFRQFNLESGPLGYEVHRIAPRKLIFRDTAARSDWPDRKWYNIDLYYWSHLSGHERTHFARYCRITRGDQYPQHYVALEDYATPHAGEKKRIKTFLDKTNALTL